MYLYLAMKLKRFWCQKDLESVELLSRAGTSMHSTVNAKDVERLEKSLYQNFSPQVKYYCGEESCTRELSGRRTLCQRPQCNRLVWLVFLSSHVVTN